MKGIEEKVIEAINDDLLEYIIEDTRNLISEFEDSIINKDYEVLDELDDLMERVFNVIELSYRYVDVPENTIPSDVAWLLWDITELKCTIINSDCDIEDSVLDKFVDAIADTISGYYVERDYYFTIEDIEAYKKNFDAELKANNILIEKSEEEHHKYIQKRNEIIENWRKENLNNDFDIAVLSEEELKILKAALEMGLKYISISWLQRKFTMGYNKACRILDHLEECGAISTFKEVKKLGFDISGRIIKISL